MARKKASRIRTTRFDAARYLKTQIDAAGYRKGCMEESKGDPQLITVAIGDLARAYGMSKLARKIGISRVGLHKALGGSGNPSFDTVLRVTRALGLDFVPVAAR